MMYRGIRNHVSRMAFYTGALVAINYRNCRLRLPVLYRTYIVLFHGYDDLVAFARPAYWHLNKFCFDGKPKSRHV